MAWSIRGRIALIILSIALFILCCNNRIKEFKEFDFKLFETMDIKLNKDVFNRPSFFQKNNNKIYFYLSKSNELVIYCINSKEYEYIELTTFNRYKNYDEISDLKIINDSLLIITLFKDIYPLYDSSIFLFNYRLNEIVTNYYFKGTTLPNYIDMSLDEYYNLNPDTFFNLEHLHLHGSYLFDICFIANDSSIVLDKYGVEYGKKDPLKKMLKRTNVIRIYPSYTKKKPLIYETSFFTSLEKHSTFYANKKIFEHSHSFIYGATLNDTTYLFTYEMANNIYTLDLKTNKVNEIIVNKDFLNFARPNPRNDSIIEYRETLTYGKPSVLSNGKILLQVDYPYPKKYEYFFQNNTKPGLHILLNNDNQNLVSTEYNIFDFTSENNIYQIYYHENYKEFTINVSALKIDNTLKRNFKFPQSFKYIPLPPSTINEAMNGIENFNMDTFLPVFKISKRGACSSCKMTVENYLNLRGIKVDKIILIGNDREEIFAFARKHHIDLKKVIIINHELEPFIGDEFDFGIIKYTKKNQYVFHGYNASNLLDFFTEIETHSP